MLSGQKHFRGEAVRVSARRHLMSPLMKTGHLLKVMSAGFPAEKLLFPPFN